MNNPQRILIGGAGGFVGGALESYLRKRGHTVERLSRSRDGKGIYWDIENEYLDPNALSSFDAVISLAGQNIFTRWTSVNMLEITSSRVKSARTINKAIAAAPNPPKVFLCASAVGYYGLNPNYTDENSPGGEGFLAEVCRQWERASNLLPTHTRIVNMRFGIIMDPSGGFFAKFAKALDWHIRPIFGDGSIVFSWIALADLCRAVEFAIENRSLEGPVNFTSARPCSYLELARASARLKKFSIPIKIPSSLMRLFMGQMASELIFSDVRAEPKKLLEGGFEFLSPNIDSFIESVALAREQAQST